MHRFFRGLRLATANVSTLHPRHEEQALAKQGFSTTPRATLLYSMFAAEDLGIVCVQEGRLNKNGENLSATTTSCTLLARRRAEPVECKYGSAEGLRSMSPPLSSRRLGSCKLYSPLAMSLSQFLRPMPRKKVTRSATYDGTPWLA